MIRAAVRDRVAAYDPAHLWITGHSLRGAWALVCAYDLVRYDGRDIRGAVTFGQPRIGDERFAAYLQEQVGDRYVLGAHQLRQTTGRNLKGWQAAAHNALRRGDSETFLKKCRDSPPG